MVSLEQLEEGQVKMQSRLEEEEEAKADLISRIQRLTKIMRSHSNGEDDAGVTMSDQMDLLVEQVKMLAGEIALRSSTLERLMDQSVNDPDGSQAQIQKLESEIQEKRRQMRVLEKHIIESGEASTANSSSVDMQQRVMRLMTQCYEKGFELEIKSVDNRILQEQLQDKCLENKELQEKLLLLQRQLASALAEKELVEEEYRRKVDEAKKREAALENDLASMWVLVAKLKEEGAGVTALKIDERSSDGVNLGNDHKTNDIDSTDVSLNDIHVSDSKESVHDGTELDPLVVRLKNAQRSQKGYLLSLPDNAECAEVTKRGTANQHSSVHYFQ